MSAPLKFKFAVNTHGTNKDWDFKVLAGKFRDRLGTIEDVVQHVGAGHALCAGLLGGKWRAKRNVTGSQWILLDIDNSAIWRDAEGNPLDDQGRPLSRKIDGKRSPVDADGKPIPKSDGRKAKKIYEHQLTLDEALEHPFISKYAALIYTTASHRPDWHKFRIVFLLPELVRDIPAYEALVRILMREVPHDPACKDASRVFYGSTKASFPLINPGITLPREWVAEAIAVAEEEEKERQQKLAELAAKRERFRQTAESEGWDVDELAHKALSYVPPRMPGSGNYHECFTVLAAIVHHFGESAAAPILESWSPSIPGDSWNIPAKVRSLRRSPSNPVTIGSLFHIAQQYGFRFPERKARAPFDHTATITEPDPEEYARHQAKMEAWEAAEEAEATERTLDRILNFFKRGRRKQPKRAEGFTNPQAQAQEIKVFEYKQGDRLETWQYAQQKGFKYILDTSGTGSGKSHDAGTATPDLFDADQLFYITDQARNPTTPTLADDSKWAVLEGRHAGKYVDDKGKIRPVTRPDQTAIEPGNCSRTHLVHALRAKNIEGADADTACQTCPMAQLCKVTSGDGYGFKHNRRKALANSCIRSHPQSLPFEDWSYEGKALIWEEFGESFSVRRDVVVTQKDLKDTIAALAMAGINAPLQPALNALLNLLENPGGRFGLAHQAIAEQIAPTLPEDIDYDAIAEATAPNLEDLQPPDSVDFEASRADLEEEIARLKAEYKKAKEDLKRQKAIALAELEIEHQNSLKFAKGGTLSEKRATLNAEYQPRFKQLQLQHKAEVAALRKQHSEELRSANRAVRRATSQHSAEAAQIIENKALKQWLFEFLSGVWEGDRVLSIRQGALTIAIPDHRQRRIIQQSKVTVMLDATLTAEDAALKLGCDPSEIFVCRQQEPPTPHLDIIQITDLGRMGMQRGADQQRRAEALVAHYKALDPTAQAIDFKKFERDGAWWRDSRGSNDFLDSSTLILVGTPCRNLNDLLVEYAILTGRSDPDDPGFQAFVNRRTRADIIQGNGRIRANRRPDEQLTVVIVSDFDLGDLPTRQLKGVEICPEAGSKFDRFVLAVEKAIATLTERGQKVTQTAVSQIAGYSQGYLSRHWKLLQTLLESLNSKSNNSEEQDEQAQLVEAIATETPPADLLEILETSLYSWIPPDKWRSLLRQLSRGAKCKLLDTLTLTLPPAALARWTAT